MKKMKNSNKTILITGVSKGIGNGLAKEFIRLGYNVIGTTRNKKSIKGLKTIYKLDITDNKSISDIKELLILNKIKIDILINNAGIGSDYYNELSLENNFEIRFRTHLFGTFYFTETILPLIKNSGKIINISSKLSSFKEIDKVDKTKLTSTKMAYIISKCSLNMYTKLLANRLKDESIEVLSIHPGWVKTSLSKTNEHAPLNVDESVMGIIKILKEKRPSGTFWDATNQLQLNW